MAGGPDAPRRAHATALRQLAHRLMVAEHALAIAADALTKASSAMATAAATRALAWPLHDASGVPIQTRLD